MSFQRSMVVGVAAAAFVLLCSCSANDTLPKAPQLQLDRSSIGFGQEFGSGTFIGTSPPESLQITNEGEDDLIITSAMLHDGDVSAFTASGPDQMTVKSKQQAFIQLIFTPTEPKVYSTTLTIKSNAANAPSQDVPVSGKGIEPDTDGGNP